MNPKAQARSPGFSPTHLPPPQPSNPVALAFPVTKSTCELLCTRAAGPQAPLSVRHLTPSQLTAIGHFPRSPAHRTSCPVTRAAFGECQVARPAPPVALLEAAPRGSRRARQQRSGPSPLLLRGSGLQPLLLSTDFLRVIRLRTLTRCHQESCTSSLIAPSSVPWATLGP